MTTEIPSGTEAYLSELKKHVVRLHDLLAHAEPGLSVWCMMYAKEMQAISDFWNRPDLKDNP